MTYGTRSVIKMLIKVKVSRACMSLKDVFQGFWADMSLVPLPLLATFDVLLFLIKLSCIVIVTLIVLFSPIDSDRKRSEFLVNF